MESLLAAQLEQDSSGLSSLRLRLPIRTGMLAHQPIQNTRVTCSRRVFPFSSLTSDKRFSWQHTWPQIENETGLVRTGTHCRAGTTDN